MKLHFGIARVFTVLMVFSGLTHALPEGGSVKPITVITHDDDSALGRNDYERKLLELALDRTVSTHGAYRIQASPEGMTHPRAARTMRLNQLPNYIRSFAYNNPIVEGEGFSFVKFPVYLGALGYRVCFVSEHSRHEVSAISSVEKLRDYTHVQGLGWLDSLILQANGFKVVHGNNFDSYYRMISAGRADLFCRGINEFEAEYRVNKKTYGLVAEQNFVLYYPMPMFFYANDKSHEVLTRLSIGLRLAYEDGSIAKLWENHYANTIALSCVNERNIIRLKNPLIGDELGEIEEYFVNDTRMRSFGCANR